MSMLSKASGRDDIDNASKGLKDNISKRNKINDALQKQLEGLQPGIDAYGKLAVNPLDYTNGMSDYAAELKANGIGDPYSPAMNELRTGSYRDDTGQALQKNINAIQSSGPTGAGSSFQDTAINNARLGAATDNAAFARNLRIKGGEERYTNYNAQRDKYAQTQFAKLSALGDVYNKAMDVQGMMSGNIGGMDTAYNNIGQQGQKQWGDTLGAITDIASASSGNPAALGKSRVRPPNAGKTGTGQNGVDPYANIGSMPLSTQTQKTTSDLGWGWNQ